MSCPTRALMRDAGIEWGSCSFAIAEPQFVVNVTNRIA